MNHNGTLILHANPQLAYTSDQNDYCGQAGLAACSLAVSTVPYDGTTRVFHVVAAFPDTSQPRLKALAWGVAYDQAKVVIAAHGPCGTGEFDIRDAGWPGNGTGIGQSWTSTRTSILNEIYWFAGYAYGAADTTSLRLTPHPVQGGLFVDDSAPPAEDLITGYGWMGFGQGGHLPCAGGPESGGGDGQAEGDGVPPDLPDAEGHADEEGGEPGQPDSPGGEGGGVPPAVPDPDALVDELTTNLLSIWIEPSAISLGTRSGEPMQLLEVPYLDADVALTLFATGATTIAPEFPAFGPEDTLGVNARGSTVRLPNLSDYYVVAFASAQGAADAIPEVLATPGIRSATLLRAAPTQTPPTDPYFWDFPVPDPSCTGDEDDCRRNPEWFVGQPDDPGRPPYGPACAPPDADIDINPPASWPGQWTPGFGATIIASIDTGILDSHEDLHLWPIPEYLRSELLTHPDHDWCAVHGTKMAGLAAAAGNEWGIVGVCPDCYVMDVESASCSESECAGHDDARCSNIAWNWAQKVATIGDAFPTVDVPVVNIQFAQFPDTYLGAGAVASLWRAYLTGKIAVAPHGNEPQDEPVHVAPAGLSCVLGMGGFTHDGRFWAPPTSCTSPGNQTTPGPGIDLCAPASPGFVTTNPERVYDPPPRIYNDWYWWTRGMCSGASAIGAGAIGYLHTRYRYATHFGNGSPYAPIWPTPDEITGVLEATARPWDPDPRTYMAGACQSCDLEDYGPGRLDLDQAWRLFNFLYLGVEDFYGANPQWLSGLQQDRAIGWDDPGVQITSEDYIANNQTIREFTVGKTVYIPRAYLESWDIAKPRIAWVNRVPSSWGIETPTSLLSYGADSWSGHSTRYLLAYQHGITDASMGVIDQQTGLVRITGHNFATVTWDESENEVLTYLVPPAEFKIVYTVIGFGDPPAALNEDLDATDATDLVRMDTIRNPVAFPCEVGYELRGPAPIEAELFDATGRCRWRKAREVQSAGTHSMLLDPHVTAGGNLPRGVYWLRIRAGTGSMTRQLVHLK